jgi:hypothetical protein
MECIGRFRHLDSEFLQARGENHRTVVSHTHQTEADHGPLRHRTKSIQFVCAIEQGRGGVPDAVV